MGLASLDPRGPAASIIADLWWILLGLGAGIFLVFLLLLVRALRARVEVEGDERRLVARWIVGGGVVLPFLAVMAVFVLTVAAMRSLPVSGNTGRLVVEVTGHQWWWDVVYPESGVRTANEVHIPVDTEVELRLLAADVVHSFWVPSLAGKMDLLPDKATSLVIEANDPGTYRGACAEFCGLQHAKMALTVIATSDPQFRDWLVGQSEGPTEPDSDSTARGLGVFLASGCEKCHTIEGVAAGLTGPDLTHIASRFTLAAGSFPNTPEHLRDWISRPQELKTGVAMEDIALSSQELDDLIAYLVSLK